MLADDPLSVSIPLSLPLQYEARKAEDFKPSIWEQAMANTVTLAPSLVGKGGGEWTMATHSKYGTDTALLREVYQEYRRLDGRRLLTGKNLSPGQKLDLMEAWSQNVFGVEQWCRAAFPELPAEFRLPTRITEWGKKSGYRNGVENAFILGLKGFIRRAGEVVHLPLLEEADIEMRLLSET